MKALIEEKKRQRTISNGSLDNCIITKDNRLIKIDPALLECKRHNSFIARFKRSLGFSSQSLNKSKSSLAGIPSIVIDAVNEAQKENSGAKFSPIFRPSAKQVATPQSNGHANSDSPKSDGSGDSGVCTEGQKLASDSLSLNELWLRLMREEQSPDARSVSSCHSVNNPVIMTGNKHHPGLDASIISVQVMPHFSSADGTNFPRRRSSKTDSCWSYSNPVLSASSTSFVSRSLLSIPQQVSQCSIESVAAEVQRRENRGTVMMLLYVLRDMLEFNLLKSPIFALLVVASVLTLLGRNHRTRFLFGPVLVLMYDLLMSVIVFFSFSVFLCISGVFLFVVVVVHFNFFPLICLHLLLLPLFILRFIFLLLKICTVKYRSIVFRSRSLGCSAVDSYTFCVQHFSSHSSTLRSRQRRLGWVRASRSSCCPLLGSQTLLAESFRAGSLTDLGPTLFTSTMAP